ncbi:MAG: hypothetical protein QOE56_1830 [Solirubrobacterales bacterium]|jgi:hypothetical protein|nr:hypothetical protein [Solirubrobacterales bacterium]
MANLSVPDVFAPDDRVALFCVSMAMAANDVEYAIRQAVLANPDGAGDEERERLRFSQKVRLTYGFLFEGIDALKAWRQQELAVATLLRQLPKDGAKLLTKVCGLEQQIGIETIAHVRHNTFHYPHPQPRKGERAEAQIRELGDVIAGLDDRSATVALSEGAEHTFPFADQIATRMALLRHDDDAQTLAVRDGAIAFVNLVRHIHLRFCKQRGISFELVGEGPDDFQILTHRQVA